MILVLLFAILASIPLVNSRYNRYGRELTSAVKILNTPDNGSNKELAAGMARQATEQLSFISTLSFTIVFLLIVLIAYNIYQVNDCEKRLLFARLNAEKQILQKTNLMASVSHEIRNPLTVIQGYIDLLTSGPLSEIQYKQAKSIKLSSDLLLATVNDILDFSKLEAGKMIMGEEPLQPQVLAEDVHIIMKFPATQKGLNFILDTGDLTPGLSVIGDIFRLKQVLINLVSNAIKFTNLGTITLKVSDNKIAGEDFHFGRNTIEKTKVCFEVTDTGIGIAADKIKAVFNEFEQVSKTSTTGTGLGLAIVKKIVLLYGGTIDIKSKLGKGSAVCVTTILPVIENLNLIDIHLPVIPWFLSPVQAAFDLFKNKRILLVDDNHLILELAKFILDRQQAHVTIAEDGTTAWNLFRDNPFDAVITDINLPSLSGIEIAANIRQFSDKGKSVVPVFALTGNSSERDISEYKRVGFTAYISKPFNEKALLETVKRYLQ